MKHQLENYEQYAILSIKEEKLNSAVAPELKSLFVEIDTAGAKNMIIDMGQVKYSDSSGLSAILVGNRTFENRGVLVLYDVQDHVKKLISISMLDKVLNILPTKEEAIDFVFMSTIENQLKDSEEEE